TIVDSVSRGIGSRKSASRPVLNQLVRAEGEIAVAVGERGEAWQRTSVPGAEPIPGDASAAVDGPLAVVAPVILEGIPIVVFLDAELVPNIDEVPIGGVGDAIAADIVAHHARTGLVVGVERDAVVGLPGLVFHVDAFRDGTDAAAGEGEVAGGRVLAAV